MPWGGTAYNPAAKKLVGDLQADRQQPAATYQEIQWANFTQTFSSAIASNTGPAVSTRRRLPGLPVRAAGRDRLRGQPDRDDARRTARTTTSCQGLVDAMKTDERLRGRPVAARHPGLVVQQDDLRPARPDAARRRGTRLMTVGKALTAKGYYGFAAGAGAGNNLGAHSMVMMMINNGGGLFDPTASPTWSTPATSQAMEFVHELVKAEDRRPARRSATPATTRTPSGRARSSRWASTRPASTATSATPPATSS